MISQEELFQFFQTIGEELYNEGYPILNKLRYPFPGIPTDEEIIINSAREGSEEESNEDD